MLTDQQLMQYSRHLMLPEVDVAAQEIWLNSKVLIVGLGGLGSPVALYLAAAGIQTLVLVDDDQVELSNLQRQIIHQQSEVGAYKAESAGRQVERINPETQVICIAERLAGESLQQCVSEVDLVVDCTDNFATRHALNRACVAHQTPLVSGAAIRFEGQISVYDSRDAASPCYRCLYPEDARVEQNCSTSGVFSPLVGIVGTIQAAEALKVLAGIGESLTGRLLLVDALRMDWRTMKLQKDPQCPVCGSEKG